MTTRRVEKRLAKALDSGAEEENYCFSVGEFDNAGGLYKISVIAICLYGS